MSAGKEKSLDRVRAYEDFKDPYGKGLSTQKALDWENLINTFGLAEIYNLQKMKQDNLYMVNPDFIDKNYKGSGTYYTSGPYKGKILLNATRPSNELLNNIIPHELVHKQTGALGGIAQNKDQYFQALDAWLTKIGEEKKRFAQERLAYGQTESGKDLAVSGNPNYRFYMKGQMGNPYE